MSHTTIQNPFSSSLPLPPPAPCPPPPLVLYPPPPPGPPRPRVWTPDPVVARYPDFSSSTKIPLAEVFVRKNAHWRNKVEEDIKAVVVRAKEILPEFDIESWIATTFTERFGSHQLEEIRGRVTEVEKIEEEERKTAAERIKALEQESNKAYDDWVQAVEESQKLENKVQQRLKELEKNWRDTTMSSYKEDERSVTRVLIKYAAELISKYPAMKDQIDGCLCNLISSTMHTIDFAFQREVTDTTLVPMYEHDHVYRGRGAVPPMFEHRVRYQLENKIYEMERS
jgi:hypothetical protein